MNKKYSWALDGRYNLDAGEVGRFLEGLPDLQPETIWKAAKNPKCILHGVVDWAKDTAAKAYQLWQIRQLLGNLIVDVVITKRDKPETVSVKAIHKVDRAGTREMIETAFAVPDKRNYILAQALAQLRALKRRYSSLSELAVVFAAFDKVAARHGKRA